MMKTDSLTRSATRFFSGTLLSRISGMCRDMVMAYTFGTSPAIATFLLAYRFVYLLRRLFGEGLLHQGVIPAYENHLAESAQSASRFFRDLFATFALLLAFVLLLIAGGLSLSSHPATSYALTLLPGIFFLCLFGLTTALLQANNHFWLSSSAPIFFNCIWIVGLFLSPTVPTLRVTLVIGFVAQWGVTVPTALKSLRLSLKELFAPRPFHTSLKPLIRPILLGITGVAAIQINTAVDSLFAYFTSAEGPAYLWYAARLQQLPLALFGIALSSALLPALSRADESTYKNLLSQATNQTLLLMTPVTIGIFTLGASSINLLFGRGDFSLMGATQTTLCLWAYGAGLLPAALVQIFAPAFYSRKDYATPARAFTYSALCNIVLNAVFVFAFHLGPASIALATSLSALFNVLYLLPRLPSRPQTGRPPILLPILGGVATLGIGWLLADPTLAIVLGNAPEWPREFTAQLMLFASQACPFFLMFFGVWTTGYRRGLPT